MSECPRPGRRITAQAIGLALSLGALSFGALSLGAAGAALAQSQAAGPALSLDEVRACLCLERSIGDLRRETDLHGQLRTEREAELDRVDQEIEQRRATIDVNDPAAIQALQSLVARQQRLRDLLRAEVGAAYREGVRQLNAKVASYNEQCTTRPMFKLDVERAKENLQCPAP